MPPPSTSTFTAGAIRAPNEKGEMTMQKVKVTRYVQGKRPANAPEESDSEEDEFIVQEDGRESRRRNQSPERERERERERNEDVEVRYTEEDFKDPRMQRLLQRSRSSDESEEETDRRPSRHIAEPEIIAGGSGIGVEGVNLGRIRLKGEEDDDEDDETQVDRRAFKIQRAQERLAEEAAQAINVKVEEDEETDQDSDYEDGTDSEDETNPRLKPVFVRKQDRISLKEKQEEEKKAVESEKKAKKRAEERRIDARRMVEQEVKRDMQDQLKKTSSEMDDTVLDIPVIIDNEDPEAEYESWKVRELTRMKRDRDERDAYLKEHTEIERLRNLTEEERLRELTKNPKQITNKTQKGKMKFLQKYYHRGVFYLDEEQAVLKRDYTAPTLEDHHDKAVLPKVMQVKNFGRAGRTKYTHLVDQDTTKFDAAWSEQSALNVKFHTGKSGGTKQVFEKPSAKRRKV